MLQEALNEYSALSLEFLAELPVRNQEPLSAAITAVSQAITNDHLVYAAGAGHSLAAVAETFFRAGGLAAVSPIWDQRVFPLNGAFASTDAEREQGLGTKTLENSPLETGDVLFVFSDSGINHYPVEVAKAARKRGATVIAVTSVLACQSAPLRAGTRLADEADIVLDAGVPVGDVSWPTENREVAPLSSLAFFQLWNLIVVGVKATNPSAPTWQSANVSQDESHNYRITEQYGPRISAL